MRGYGVHSYLKQYWLLRTFLGSLLIGRNLTLNRLWGVAIVCRLTFSQHRLLTTDRVQAVVTFYFIAGSKHDGWQLKGTVIVLGCVFAALSRI
mgnify:CR=1 FL=1